jgi:hypothetical protein
MSEPIVTATGDTVSLLHNIYLVVYPDGTTEELVPVQCKREAADEMEWVLRRARATWKRRQRSTGATGEAT